MKPNLRRVLALFLALLLALPSFAFAEDLSVVSGEIDPPVEERGTIELDENGSENSEGNESNGLTIEPPTDVPEELPPDDLPNEAPTATPFTQSVILDSVTIYVTANAGVYPANAALKVEAVEDDSIAQAVETAIGEDGVYTHRLYRVETLDADGNVTLPDYARGVPAVRVEGLNLPAEARVVMFDAVQETVFYIDATREAEADAIVFGLLDAAVYDIVTLSPLPKQEEPAEDLGDAEPLDEPALDAEPAEEAEEISEEPEVSAQPVAVAFEVTPETAVVTVRRTDSEEPIPAQADGSFLLLPGDYTYTAEAEGYVSIEAVPFTVAGEALTLSFIMEQAAAELSPYDFDQSQTVGGATITVQAEAGVFPDGARLTVSEPAAVRRMMKAAAKGGEQATARVTARSYSYDISVTDAEGQPIQPAAGTTVTLSFALAEANDPNLTPRVLHEGVEIPCHVENGAVVAQTDGFSRYTVEFTYDAKQYVLQGDTSVAMSEILSAIGLTGDVTAAEVSDDSLFTVSNATGEWIVTALQPFSTTEWMNVTINGVTYAITVTDSNDDFALTGTDEYTIYTDAGWVTFCDRVEVGNTFENKTVKLGASITVSSMAGHDNTIDNVNNTDYTVFKGTFDGQGNTLTFNYENGSTDYIAPFPRVDGATFRNLTVKGTINTTASYPGGLIGHTYGTVTIEHCASSVDLTSAGGAGGFVARCERNLYFTDCVSSAVTHSATGNNSGFVGWSRDSRYTISFTGCLFNGKILKKDGAGDSNGCFIGWTGNNKTVIAENCLCAPAALADGETLADSRSATFARRSSNPTGSTTITNCYYTAAFGTEQGARAYAVRAGDYTTVGFGTATNTYNVSGITGYANGIVYDGTFYSASGTSLNLTLGHADREGYAFTGYAASAGTLNGNALTMPANDVTVSAVYEITGLPYIDENGEPQSCTQYTALTEEATTLTGWVVVAQDVNMGDTRLAVSGEARLILCDGVTLTVGKGIQLTGDNNSLTIYGQTNGTGKLYAGTTDGEVSTCDDDNAGIGGNASQKGGALTINGGAVTAKGGEYGAGIGGGDGGAGGEVTINGGTVTANGGRFGAGIGGGFNGAGGEVTITGGTVKANAGYDAAGIGGGCNGAGGEVTITGGKVEATGNYRGAGIGGCYEKYNTGTLNVSFGNADDYLKANSYGGTVKVEAGHCVKYVDVNNTPHNFTGTLTDGQKSDIAGQELSKSMAVLHSVTIASTIANGTVTASKDVAAEGETVELTAAPAAGYMLDSFSVQANGEAVTVTNNQFAMPGADVTVGAVFVAKPSVTYIDYANGTATSNTKTPTEYTILTDDTAALTGWVVVLKDVDMGDTRLEVSGEARLILCDGVTLTAKKGIHLTGDNNSLTIYGQTNGTGKLYAGTTNGEDTTCEDGNAGIGGNNSQKGGALTVNGGAVTAKGGKYGAGIGGGDCGAGGEVTINGGTVKANAGFEAAGIGGGFGGAGGEVTITGGTVKANAGYDAAGIGGGYDGAGGEVTITGGKVEATGNYRGAGIGGCYEEYNTGTLNVSFGNADDYLKANSYGGTVKVEDGHCIKYVDGNNTPHTFTGTLADDQKSDIAGKELQKALNPHAVSVTSSYNAAIASPVLAEAGATVTLTASAGFNITGVTATDGSGQSVTVTEGTGDDAGKWFFTMPDSDVSVSATAALIYNFNDLSVNDAGTAYTIHTSAGWGNFCALLNDAPKGFFTGKTVYLGADIGTAANPVTTMAGDSDHPFTGTFDGQHNTLTISYSGGEVCAPFRYVEGGTIQNLNVAGSITASGKFAGSIIGKQKGSVTIKDCTGSVTIASSVSGDGTHGGLVGHNEAGTLKIEGCVFDGKLLTTNGTTHCGGFVGWAGNKVEIIDSLYAPSEPSEDETWVGDSNSATFSRGDADKITISTSYYTRAFGTAQGTRVYTVTPADGLTISAETSYLNGIVNHGGTLYAKQGANVELDVTPPSGRTVDKLTVKDASENDVTVTNNRFTMPDADVTVSATFVALPSSITYDLQADDASIPEPGYIVTASFRIPFTIETVTCNDCDMDWDSNGGYFKVELDNEPQGLEFSIFSTNVYDYDEEEDEEYTENINYYGNTNGLEPGTGQLTMTTSDSEYSCTLAYTYTNNPEALTAYTAGDLPLALPVAIRPNYTFGGWRVNSAQADDAVTQLPAGTTGDVTLYAVWTPKQYTLTFDTKGGSAIAPITQGCGTAITAPGNPTRDGYTFDGWDPALPTAMPAENMTVSAKWKAADYAISYDLNGGTMDGAGYVVSVSATNLPDYCQYPEDVKVYWNNSQKCSNNQSFVLMEVPTSDVTIKLEVPSYSWDEDAGDFWYAGDICFYGMLSASAFLNGGTLTLWDDIGPLDSCTFEWSLAGASNPSSYTVEDDDIRLLNPLKANCEFMGWTGSNGETPETSVTIAHGSTGDKAYTANWTENTVYSIEIAEADGGSVSATVNSSPVTEAAQGVDITLSVTPNAGYALSSLIVDNVDVTNQVSSGAYTFGMPDADVTVTATFKPVEYSITYDLDGGSIPGEGYTVTASFDAPNDYNVVTVKCNGARMDENEDGYSVTFDDMPESLGFYVWCDDYWGEDEEGDLLYDNYYFYSTDSQEPGNGSVTMEEEDGNCGSFTLYYSSAPTSGNPTRYTVEDDAIALRNPVKSHYTFVGWTGSNGTTPETAVTIPRGSTGDKSYAAVWEAERHTITFIDYFDSTVFATITQEYGTAITVPELPEHEGYELLGWSAEIPETMPDWDMTIYAYWKTVEYAITYDLDGGTAGYTGEGYTVSLSRVPNVMREWEFYVLYREEWAHQFEPSFHLEEAMTEAVDVCLHYYENDEYGDEIASVNYRATLSAEDFMTSRTVTLTKDGDSAATVAITWTVTPGTASNPVRYTIQSGDIALLPPTKAGVVFAGWTGSNGETPETSVTIAHGSTGDKSYTANWVQYFTVTFDINGGESDPPEDQTVASGDTAEKPNDPTKEGYRFLGWFADGATEAFDFTAPITASLELTAHWQKVYTVTITADAGCVVTVTAVDSLDADDGTPVASGDLVDENTLLKVSATPKAGYRLTETPDESYTVNTDLTITAVSEALSYALTLTHDNGAAPTANVSDLAAIPYGTRVTLTAGAANDGYVFVGWYQTNGVQLGAEAEYTRVMYGDMTIEARYKATTHVVTFMANGQERGSFTGSAIAQGDFPADPSPVNGEQFDRWDMTVDEINAELDKGNNVTVTAVFSKVQNHFTVTIYNGEEAAETVACEQTTTIKRRAKDVEGKVFAWWTLDGERFSYNKTASFIATQDCELRAVYTASPVEAEGTATIRTVSYNPETRKLSFNAYLTVPDGSTITAAGLVAASGSGAYNPNETLTTANADYSKALASATGKCAPVDYTWNKTQVSPGDVWYVRARIAYTDSQGIAREIYGERVRVCAGTDYDASEKGTASIRRFSYNESTRKLSFNAYLTVPENTTIVKAGLVAIGSTFDPTTQLLTASNAAYVKSLKDAEGKCAPVDYTWNKTNVSRGDTWYARAYLVYTDAAGREHTVYGELITAVAN